MNKIEDYLEDKLLNEYVVEEASNRITKKTKLSLDLLSSNISEEEQRRILDDYNLLGYDEIDNYISDVEELIESSKKEVSKHV